MRQQRIFPALQLTDACNKQCAPCLRTANRKAFWLKYDQLRAYLKDIEVLSSKYTISYQFVTGGEPTIWRDGDRDIVDALQTLDQAPFVQSVVLPTNGKVMEDEEQARRLLSRLARVMTRSLVVGLSVAEYQENFDDRGCQALDNLLKIREKPRY